MTPFDHEHHADIIHENWTLVLANGPNIDVYVKQIMWRLDGSLAWLIAETSDGTEMQFFGTGIVAVIECGAA